MKKIIRLTESDLHRIVKESVRRILGEEKKPHMGPSVERAFLGDDEEEDDEKKLVPPEESWWDI